MEIILCMWKRETPPNTAPAAQELRKHPPLFVMPNANYVYRIAVLPVQGSGRKIRYSSWYDSTTELAGHMASLLASIAIDREYQTTGDTIRVEKCLKEKSNSLGF